MAFERFFAPYDYNPYDDDYYTAAAAQYNCDPYCQRQRAPTRRSKPAAKPARRARDTKTSFSIPVHGPDSDPEPKRERKTASAAAVAEPVTPAMSAEEAVVRMQAAVRGLLARKSVRAVREVQREAEQVREKMMSEAETLLADRRVRVAVGEALMRMLLRLDAVRGARDYRRRVTKRVLALQDAVDALEAPAPVGEEADADAPEATAVEMEEESAAAQELLDATDYGSEMESIWTAADTPTQVEVDEAIAAGEHEVEAGEEEEKDANADVDDEAEDSDAEGEWEMVTEEENEHIAPVAATSDDQEPPRKEPACPPETTTTASAGAASEAVPVDVRKVMEMVTALNELSAKQCAVIGALAERLDALERTVRRMEDAESRRQRSKKLGTEGK